MEKISILLALILGIWIFLWIFWHQIKNFRSNKNTTDRNFFES
jgi:hypothetical protein